MDHSLQEYMLFLGDQCAKMHGILDPEFGLLIGVVFKSVSLARVRKSPLWPQTLQRMTLVAWEADRVHLAKFLHAQSGSI